MSNKLGFWAVFSIVVGSQIGSGIFMLPASLAPYGKISILGWLLSGSGALCLALVFSGLCRRFPRTGGPHVYVKEMFGPQWSFFTGWTYWVISWVSTAAVVIASISYLSPFLPYQSSSLYLCLELGLLILITLLNLKGLHAAGMAELILTLIKIMALFLLPLLAIWHFDPSHFIVAKSVAKAPFSTNLANVTLLTLWGFIGLESATTPAGDVIHPAKTIPKAIVFGTLATVILYLLTSIAIMGAVPGDILANSKAPYADACQYLFAGQWHYLIAIIASIVCIGTLNAWVLTSGQIVLGLSEDKLMPSIFAQKNRNQAPYLGIISSAIGIMPLLILTMNENVAQQITDIIDFSVIAFLFVYLICVCAYIKIIFLEKSGFKPIFYTFLAFVFCVWTISQTPLYTVMTSSLFVLSGIPMYFFWFKNQSSNQEKFPGAME